jgi:V8-like Glu-specific endopeptidase
MRHSIVLAVIAAVAASLLAASTPAAAGGDDASLGDLRARDHHERVVSYWTPERRASAIPLDVQLPAARPTSPPGKGGGGGGSEDDGGSTTVTGATWTEGGDAAATVGKVFFTLNGTNYQCSGGAVQAASESLVVTAGHCVHAGNNGSFATNWTFWPRYDGAADEKLGVWTATSLHTTEGWATQPRHFDDDVGFATVVGSSDETLEAVLLEETVTIPTVAFDQTWTDVSYFAFGYPAAKKYSGSTLTYCAGPVRDDLDSRKTLALACDMTGGSSGGPWIREYRNGVRVVESVNSYGYRSLKDVMFGPIFDDGEKNAFDAATDGVCDTGERCWPLP